MKKRNTRRKEREQENPRGAELEEGCAGGRWQRSREWSRERSERADEGVRRRERERGEGETENGNRAEDRDGVRGRARAREKAIDAHPLTLRASLPPAVRPSRPAASVVQPPFERWRPSWRRMQISMAPRRPPARPSPTRFAIVCTYIHTHARACVCVLVYASVPFSPAKPKHRPSDRQTDRLAGRQAGWRADGRTDRQTRRDTG